MAFNIVQVILYSYQVIWLITTTRILKMTTMFFISDAKVN